MKISKKIIVMSVLGVMLVTIGYMNYTGNYIEIADNGDDNEYIPVGEATPVSSGNITENGQNDENYFKKAKIDKESERAQSVELLKDIINNSNSSQEAKNNAENKLAAIANNIEIEATTEGLIKAKGYKDAVVYISDSAVDVVVASNELTAADTAKIRDIVFEQTNNNNIKIVAVK